MQDTKQIAETPEEKCPYTNLPFFMEILNDRGELVRTFGGPFDSYSIPTPDDYSNDYYRERFCHDRGEWIDGGETIEISQEVIIERIKNIIINFGSGETEFHTKEISILLSEIQQLKSEVNSLEYAHRQRLKANNDLYEICEKLKSEKEKQDIRAEKLATALEKVKLEWHRQRSLFKDLQKDGWMDFTINNDIFHALTEWRNNK